MIFAILGAIVVGLSLGVFGSGGSILTVPVLVYLLGHEDKIAIAESLGIVGAIALVGSIPYAIDKLVEWRLVIFFGVPGMAGTFAGAWISGFVPGEVQLLVFGGVMVLAATRMWQRARAVDRPDDIRRDAAIPAAAVRGVGVGLLTGFVGVGGGFLIVPALVLLGGLSMRRAVATSLVIIAMNALVGLAKHRVVLTGAGQDTHWDVMLVFIAVGIVGSLAGRAIQGRLDQRALQTGFAGFLALMSLFILIRESVALFGA